MADETKKPVPAGDALFGFMAWLTMLDEPVTLSASHDAAIGVDLVTEWMQQNGIEGPSRAFPNNISHPHTRSFEPLDVHFISRFTSDEELAAITKDQP